MDPTFDGTTPSPHRGGAPTAALFPLSTVGRALLAVLSLSAATIHLVMVPAHASEWLPEGLAFAASGWFQIGFAIAIIVRPSRPWLRVGIVANLVLIIAWAVTRTAGMPFGPEAGSAEAAQLIDLTCVGAEAALVLACSVFARHPRLGETFDSAKLVAASIVPVGVLVLTTAALASPSASNHVHGGSETTAHAHDTSGTAADGHDHSHGDQPTVAAADRCDWSMNTIAFWKQNPPASADTSHDHMTGSAAESAATGSGNTSSHAEVGNHHGVQAWKPMTDKAACADLQSKIDTMQTVTEKYPTLQSALDAGCKVIVKYVPGIGAHVICYPNLITPLDVSKPEMLLYGGNKPWAPMVGLSYYSMSGTAPDASWLDGQMPFHVHDGLCFRNGQVVGGDGSTKEACAAKGGIVGGQTGFMGHYWVPSCSSPDGVFSADNPRLDAGVAQYNDDEKFDPANGGDPTQLQANPCVGTKVVVGPDDKPGSSTSAEGETAAGSTGTK